MDTSASERDEQRLIDILNDASKNLWNALLTMNAIFISAFSLVMIIRPHSIYLGLIVVLSIVSSGLLIWNFRDTQQFYKFLGEMDEDFVSRLSAKEHASLGESPHRKRQRIEKREQIVILLLIAKAVLLVVLLVYHQYEEQRATERAETPLQEIEEQINEPINTLP